MTVAVLSFSDSSLSPFLSPLTLSFIFYFWNVSLNTLLHLQRLTSLYSSLLEFFFTGQKNTQKVKEENLAIMEVIAHIVEGSKDGLQCGAETCLFSFVFLRQGLTVKLRLALNLLQWVV